MFDASTAKSAVKYHQFCSLQVIMVHGINILIPVPTKLGNLASSNNNHDPTQVYPSGLAFSLHKKREACTESVKFLSSGVNIVCWQDWI